MITNERQYRISKNAADRFRQAIDDLSNDGARPNGISIKLLTAQRDALQSQLDDLTTEIEAYEKLKTGAISSITINSFNELADGLISARIAAGLSQKALGDRLGLKEQQIQRYESERYASASYQRLQDIARAIGIEIRKEILLPSASTNLTGLLQKLRQVGLSREFVFTNLLSHQDEIGLQIKQEEDTSPLLLKLSSTLTCVYGWTADMLFGAAPLTAPRFAGAEARFKIPARRTQNSVSIYATYANYLASIVLQACTPLPTRVIPLDPKVFRSEIEEVYGTLDLRSTLRFAWDCGVPILPLKGQGTFHGACWRYEGRNVIVLKQTSPHEERWLFDLLHELFHAGTDPQRKTHETVEVDEVSHERRDSEEEIAATQFAGDVVLHGRTDELAEACVKAAEGSVERLKSAVPAVAKMNRVSVGAMANYLAFRLSWQGINWWGTAANLQSKGGNPWEIARDVFLERFPFKFESEVDRQLLERALR